MPLTGAGQLEDEGAAGTDRDGMAGLDHCVGGHAGACLSGASRIVSLRATRDGKRVRLSTAEFRPGRDGPDLVQHRGHANGPAPDVAKAALDGYVADLRSGRLSWDPDAWTPVGGGDPVTLAAGYDWATGDNWEAALQAWSPFIPRHLRHVDAAGLARLATADGFGGRRSWRRPGPANQGGRGDSPRAGRDATVPGRPGM